MSPMVEHASANPQVLGLNLGPVHESLSRLSLKFEQPGGS